MRGNAFIIESVTAILVPSRQPAVISPMSETIIVNVRWCREYGALNAEIYSGFTTLADTKLFHHFS